MAAIDSKMVYRNPDFSNENEARENDSIYYRIVLGCGYKPLKWNIAVGNNPDNKSTHKLQTVSRR